MSIRDKIGEVLFWTLLVGAWLAGGWAFFEYIVVPGRQTLVFTSDIGSVHV